MNADQNWLTSALLAELAGLNLTELPPMHVIDKRLALADMILTELDDTDPEQMAWRADAEALRALCFDPTNPVVIDRYRAALNAHAELLRSVFPGLC